MKRRILNILLWSIVSAAFIGPGTVTTAAKSGNIYGAGLLWALLFSTLACLLLQEAAARISLKTGRNLGENMKISLGGTVGGKFLLVLTAIAIVGGAAAYEMGNLIGAREGIRLIFLGNGGLYSLLLGILAGLILMIPSLKVVSRIMGLMVIVLGISFLYTAIKLQPSFSSLLKGAFIPAIPDQRQAPFLILGLIGTTIVPYNIFLGSGLGKQIKGISAMRFGLAVAILLGGLFSMSVVVVGTAVSGEFSFEKLAEALVLESGKGGRILLGTGLFAAGFTSAITAPLASAITLKSIFGDNSKRWSENGIYYRLSWMLVLLTGLLFALIGFKPIPAIITAQALNGFTLPFISFFLVWILNDPSKTGQGNSAINNLLLSISLVITLVIGLKNLLNVFLTGEKIVHYTYITYILIFFSVILTFLFMIRINRRK